VAPACLALALLPEGTLKTARHVLMFFALLLTGAGVPSQRGLPPALPHDNRVAAGILRDGVLTVALEVRQAMWHPDGDTLPGLTINAFAEAGKDARVPGPLLRVEAGVEIRGTLHNTLARDTVTFFMATRVGREATADLLDRVVVPPGDTRELRIVAANPGTYLYRATTGAFARRPALRMEGLLAGALIVDSANVATPPDRIFVLQAESDLVDRPGSILQEVMAVNGRSWPHTERLGATVGDTLHWRVLNASTEFHPMHLHGFFFRVDAFNAEARVPQEGASGRMVVTERMPPASTMSITWIPERAGNWLFHCHFQQHVVPHRHLGDTASLAPRASGHVEHANHALTGMGGLVMGVLVRPKAGTGNDRPIAARRRLRLVATRDSGFPDSVPSLRFRLEERGTRALDAGPGFSPTISLTRGEPVSITVVNRLSEPTAVHWHGIELESFYDGVAGFSGSGTRLAPVVAPGDSFEVRMTPPRSGTFLYHSHVDEPRQHRAGLAGALIVRDRDPVDRTDDHVFFIKSARAGEAASPEFEINGQQNPDTVVLQAGRRYRFRFIGLQVTNPNAAVSLIARREGANGASRDSIVQWRRVAKDAFELPEPERTLRTARESISMGETYDYEFTPTQRGEMRIEIRVAVPVNRVMVRAPIRVQ
jgi:FtsP/CotA-like multicopper oxidase with cupredoxin domain